ncbi:hypothetical protein PV325_011136 [Microctonus aethiopoides]|nr:hypothetical protein PV325_011136 [Microctonus aethiopoides]
MITWAQCSSQQYRNYNVASIQQATWSPQANCNQFQYYSVNTINYPASTFIYPQNRCNNNINNNYFQSAPNLNTTFPPSQRYYSANINTPRTTYNFTDYKQRNETNNSTMEPENYYQVSRFNDYSVHFRNQYALSSNEIINIFKEFGEINSYKQTGDQYGLFFVNFKNEDSAIRSIKALADHPKIKFRMNKYYNASKNSKNDNSNESKKYNGTISSSGRNNSMDNQENTNQQREEKSNSSDNLSDKRFNAVETNEPKKILNNQNIYDNYSKKIDDHVGDDVQSVAANNGEHDVGKNNFELSDLPELISASKKNIILKSEIEKDLINSVPITTNGLKKPIEVFEAQEVIVANIEEHYGTPAILHLLEKYQPICASPIKLSKPHSIRYCHVYFNNVIQAESAEHDFDEYEWSENKKLIVLRVDTLAALALKS